MGRAEVEGAATGAPLPGKTEAEEIRRRHLGREANIRSMALLVYLNAGIMMFMGLAAGVIGIVIPFTEGEPPTSFQERLLSGVIVLAIAVFLITVGYWFWHGASDLRRLSRTGRPAGVAWGILSLLNIPVGTLLGLFMLAILLDSKAYYVLSPEYRDVVGQTPDMEYRWSIITKVFVWLLAAVLLLILLAGFVAVVGEMATG